jgi:uncharacterized protein YndB with AHSA1/START domain
MTMTEIVMTPGVQEIILSRTFQAPPELVFRAHTDPEMIPQWWGPRRLTTTVDALDARHGGTWRFVQHDEDGNEYAFRGVFHTVEAPTLLVWTFEFEGEPGHVMLKQTSLTAEGPSTRLDDRSVFLTVSDRDQMVSDGMEEGTRESIDRLEELLARQTELASRR